MNPWAAFPAILSALLGASESTSLQRARIEKLEETFLAPCCYAEPVSRHRSELALQMRAEIAQWVAEGKPDREIIDAYKQRYGARILVEPEGASWWWLHVIPWVAMSLALAFTIWLMGRMVRRPNSALPAAFSGPAGMEED